MHNPYDSGIITDDDAAHRRRRPPSLGGDDYAYGPGSPIIAPADGVIDLVDSDPGGSGGRMVGVRHAGGVRSEQLHASRILAKYGTAVEEGQTIALSGGSAYGKEHGVGYHIHAHFVVNGVRWGWENYLASVGAGTAGGGTAGGGWTPVDEEDDLPDMNEFLNTPAYTGGPTISALFKLLDSYPQKVWAETVRRGDVQISVKQELADAKTIAIRQEATINALAGILAGAQGGSGFTLEQIRAAAEAGARAGLTGLAANVSVELGAAEPTAGG